MKTKKVVDASDYSAVNAALTPPSARPDLVEGCEKIIKRIFLLLIVLNSTLQSASLLKNFASKTNPLIRSNSLALILRSCSNSQNNEYLHALLRQANHAMWKNNKRKTNKILEEIYDTAPKGWITKFVKTPQDDTDSLLFNSIYNGWNDITAELIEHGADVNDYGIKYCVTPLHEATYYRNYIIAKILIDNGAKLDMQSRSGDTPLFIACHNGDKKIARLLIRYGAFVPKKIIQYLEEDIKEKQRYKYACLQEELEKTKKFTDWLENYLRKRD